LQGCPKKEIHKSDPSVDRHVEIVQQLEQVFENVLQEVLGGGQLPAGCFYKRKKKKTLRY
jgi:hypothetical protein